MTENTVLQRTEAPKVRLGVPRILTPVEWGKLLAVAEQQALAKKDFRLL